MKLTVQLIEGDYWSIERVSSVSDDVTPGPGQKIVIANTWVNYPDGTAYSFKDLVWDDKDSQPIIYPEHLKVSLLKKQRLEQIKNDLLAGNRGLLDSQTIKKIIDDIKVAPTESKVDEEFAKIEQQKKDTLASQYGL